MISEIYYKAGAADAWGVFVKEAAGILRGPVRQMYTTPAQQFAAFNPTPKVSPAAPVSASASKATTVGRTPAPAAAAAPTPNDTQTRIQVPGPIQAAATNVGPMPQQATQVTPAPAQSSNPARDAALKAHKQAPGDAAAARTQRKLEKARARPGMSAGPQTPTPAATPEKKPGFWQRMMGKGSPEAGAAAPAAPAATSPAAPASPAAAPSESIWKHPLTGTLLSTGLMMGLPMAMNAFSSPPPQPQPQYY